MRARRCHATRHDAASSTIQRQAKVVEEKAVAFRSVRSIHLMWSQAFDMMERADRLQRQFFRLGQVGHMPAWEPPVDVFEGDGPFPR